MTFNTPASLRLGAAAFICLLAIGGCSDEDAPATTGGTGPGMGGASVGNAGSGTSGSGTGGSSVAQGGTSSGVGGSGGGAAGAPGDPAAPLTDNQCMGIRNNAACAFVGTCAARPCGLADLGTRDCVCNGTWACSSCAFPTDGPAQAILAAPAAGGDAGGGIPACATGVADDIVCTPMGDRCIQPPGGAAAEGCACWVTNDDGMNIWDCDNQPDTWG